MEDDELAQIRAQRMATLQKERGGGGASGSAGGAERQQQMAAQRQQAEEQSNGILAQVLDQNARARLSNIAAANPQKAQQLEAMIVQMAKYGRIRGKMDDETFKGLLDEVNEQMKPKTTTVKFDRRRANLDSDSD